ncbi:MAG: hypothetical protein K6E57_00120 [Fibrobacter sp.]|nr:hypothetical protein [Fibrobacter sp.]
MGFAAVVRKERRSLLDGFLGIAVIPCVMLLSACGDNVTTENINQVTLPGMEIALDMSTLPDCDSASIGVQVWVRSEATSFVCADNEWFRVTSDAPDYSCGTEPLEGDDGIKIVCNGDSVGVLLNGMMGKTGANGQNATALCRARRVYGTTFIQIFCDEDTLIFDLNRNPEESSSSEIFSSSFEPESSSSEPESSCSEESSSSEIESSSDVESSSSEESSSSFDEEAVQTSLDSMSGFSQKGPFVQGSNVRLYELESGRTLKQTNGNFMGVINSNDGFFKISARKLISQYALLVANGYYKNEVTGETTTEDLTLFALTDVSFRSKANVNLLTHLEYDRVFYLVTKEKVRFKEAKRQAQAEIMLAFHIDTTGIGSSEDLSVFGDTKGNAALLAISVMLQSRRSIAELTELLAAISVDLEQDGVMSDSLSIVIADGIMDILTKLPKIRANVDGWKLGDVPEFEPIVKNFMTAIYGIGNCSASDEGRIVQMQNAYSEFNGYYFVCEDENWRIKMYDSKTERYYRVAFIGSQVWMAEDYGIPDLDNPGQLKYSIPAVEISDSASIVNGGVNQGICPDGWHLPTFDEWEQQLDYVWTEKTLEEAINASSWYGSHGINVPGNIDARLITTEGNDFGTDDYDFSAEPNRNYFASSVCYDTGSRESEYLRVCYRMFNTWNMKQSTTYSYITYTVYSVRCVKD